MKSHRSCDGDVELVCDVGTTTWALGTSIAMFVPLSGGIDKKSVISACVTSSASSSSLWRNWNKPFASSLLRPVQGVVGAMSSIPSSMKTSSATATGGETLAGGVGNFVTFSWTFFSRLLIFSLRL